MTGSSKILTVSYGTFSCTLEGFDDPFSTMRTIAEYFRDLAAEDRYFGAEPPTPDPDMLQSLAEREARRRVEARVGDEGVALRQIAPSVSADRDVASSMPAVKPAPMPPADVSETSAAFEADEPENAFSDLGADNDQPHPDESIAEKLKRIRAVVSRSRDARPFPAEDVANRPAAAPTFDGDDAIRDDTVEATSSDRNADHDEDAMTEQALRDAALAATLKDIASDEDEETLEGEEPEEEVAAYLDSSLSGAPLQDDDESELHSVPDSEEIDRILEEAAEEAPDADEDHDSFDATADEAPRTEEEPALGAATDESVEAAEETEATAEDEDAVAGAREEDDAASYAGPEAVLTLVETGPEADEPDQSDDMPRRSQTRTQTRILRDTGEPDVARLMAAADEQFEDGEGQRRRRVISQLRAAVIAARADRTSQDRDKRRLSEESRQTAYRDDLSRAVPENDPLIDSAGSHGEPLMLGSEQRVDTPPPAAAAPSEQDVPQPRGETAQPVEEQDSGSFADFARSMGAHDLSDLLEAAAAYTAFVEGQTSFSRPQIMKRVARINPKFELTREAGLRSFGQLLRQGKIRKLQRGQFTISESTRFNPEQRIAGE